jgi:hypothetical protein
MKMIRLIMLKLLLLLLTAVSVAEGGRNDRSVGAVGTAGSTSSFVQTGPQDGCRKEAKRPCQPLQFSTCFGVKLPYTMTSPELVNENFTQQQLQVNCNLLCMFQI